MAKQERPLESLANAESQTDQANVQAAVNATEDNTDPKTPLDVADTHGDGNDAVLPARPVSSQDVPEVLADAHADNAPDAQFTHGARDADYKAEVEAENQPGEQDKAGQALVAVGEVAPAASHPPTGDEDGADITRMSGGLTGNEANDTVAAVRDWEAGQAQNPQQYADAKRLSERLDQDAQAAY